MYSCKHFIISNSTFSWWVQYLCRNKDKKVIYLTFDEGYENGYTATILDTLKEKGVTAVFFVTLPYVKQNPELIQRMIDENQIIRKSHLESLFYARSYR